MKKLIFFALIISFMFGCEKSPDNRIDSDYIAKIVGFDLNCNTCILEFPDDNSQVIKEIGESPSNYYQTINLSKGNYEIGQKVRVKIRKAETNELTPCITLYPSYNYENVYITEFENFKDLILNDTIELSYRNCLYQPENQFYLCLDSVLEDSRCPIGAYCIWEGNARVRFRFEKLNENPIYFILNTNIKATIETIIDRYKISLINLSPYPSLDSRPGQNGFKERIKAEIIVKVIN